MDKYEYRVKTEQMLEHYEKKQFRKAMEIADTIDWRRVKSPAMLNTVSEIYENNGEFQKSRDTLMIAFDRAPSSRKVVYRLAVLALKLNDINEASDCYEEFVKLAPRDPNQFILKYRILKAQGSDLSEQISALEEFKKAEYIEKWAYELAKLYHEAGMTSKCLEECDDLILWFSEGKYVYQAMELKMKYKPLTPLQQEKYDEYKGVPKKEPKKAADKKPERAALKDVKSIPQDTVSLPKEQIKAAQEAAEAAEAEQQESGANTTETVDGLDATRRIPTAELGEALKAMEENAKADKEVPIEESVLEEPVSEEPVLEEPEEAVSEEPEVVEMEAPVIEPIGKETPEEARNVRELEGILQHAAEGPKKSITTVVKGATLQEALANGVAMASGINPEDQKKMEEREEELRIEGQMKIEDILMEWEAKQNGNCTWTYYAPADFDAASQMSCLMDALATDPDVLICCPTAGEAVNEALAEAKLKGTLVIIIEGDDYMTNADYLLEPFEAAPFVKAYVDELVAALGDDFTYCLMVGKLTTPFQVKWCNAFYDYATATYPNLKSMTERGAWLEHNDSDDTAAEVTKQVILGHPEVSVIWSSSAGGTEGMCRAINEMGVGDTVHGAGHACPGGAKYAMENGSMLMSSIHYPGDPFAAAAELGRKVIAGETLVPGMDYEGYETLKFDGKWVYGNSWHRLTLDTVDTYIAKWPEL